MRIAYFASVEFGVPTLMKLVNSDHEVPGVVTTTSKGTTNGAPRANPIELEARKVPLPVYHYEIIFASEVV